MIVAQDIKRKLKLNKVFVRQVTRRVFKNVNFYSLFSVSSLF